jgi:hypothetical protein
MIAYNPKGLTIGSCHVAISAHQDGDDMRIRFNPLYGWYADADTIASVGLHIFGTNWGPIPLPRSYTNGEFVRSVPLDLVLTVARVEPSPPPKPGWMN